MTRLDELLADLDYAAADDIKAVVLTNRDAKYLASILRAGRELARNSVPIRFIDARISDTFYDALDNYDNAINGDGQAVPGGNDAEG